MPVSTDDDPAPPTVVLLRVGDEGVGCNTVDTFGRLELAGGGGVLAENV